MKKRSTPNFLLDSLLIFLLGSGFTNPLISIDYLQPENHYTSISFIPTEDEDDPVNEDICGLYNADCEDTSALNTKNVEIDLARAQKAKATVIFFWMQDCAHCEEMLNSLLPEMYLKFGEQVYFYPIELKEISEVDVFYQMAERLGVPKNNIGVPLMIISDQVLAGNQIEKNLEKSIDVSLQNTPYSFVPIPEFEEKLPDFLQDKQMDQTTNSANQSNDKYPIRTPFPLALIIGLPLLLIAGTIFYLVSKKVNLGN